jgi:hypothetical protein
VANLTSGGPEPTKAPRTQGFRNAPKRTRTSTQLAWTRPSTLSPGCQMRPTRWSHTAAFGAPRAGFPPERDADDARPRRRQGRPNLAEPRNEIAEHVHALRPYASPSSGQGRRALGAPCAAKHSAGAPRSDAQVSPKPSRCARVVSHRRRPRCLAVALASRSSNDRRRATRSSTRLWLGAFERQRSSSSKHVQRYVAEPPPSNVGRGSVTLPTPSDVATFGEEDH